ATRAKLISDLSAPLRTSSLNALSSHTRQEIAENETPDCSHAPIKRADARRIWSGVEASGSPIRSPAYHRPPDLARGSLFPAVSSIEYTSASHAQSRPMHAAMERIARSRNTSGWRFAEALTLTRLESLTAMHESPA